ncbi:RNA polymerase sigma factor [Paenibacillus xylaniclasticus]|uniref:RNA polymerase sigma factor n=1 Tax=Paenibacillus xylaniclasticus TaxID=588083 RepID=UPI000FD92FB9|nr:MULTISPECIES: sigma factor-like helix-turn-helix DNA-binding protein [Paenibacillus]GFN31757.1 RNA polymerase subunit sigma-24 [Paenibacillus curdlanolyticus]
MDNIMAMAINAKEGSRDDFVRIIRMFETMMYRIAFDILRSEEKAAGVVQDTIIAAYRQFHLLHEPRYVQMWLIRILMNKCGGSPSSMMMERNLYGAIDMLPWELGEILLLYYIDNLSLRAIGERLQLTEVEVKARLHQAREQLTLILDEPAQD